MAFEGRVVARPAMLSRQLPSREKHRGRRSRRLVSEQIDFALSVRAKSDHIQIHEN